MVADKSCSDCPSFVSQDTASAEFRGNLGGGYCGRFGYVLGKPGLTDAAIATLHRDFASGCDSHGIAILDVEKQKFPTAVVASADPAVLMEKAAPGYAPERLGSCMSCERCVESSAVRDEFGWPLPLCAATGRLLMNHRWTAEPRLCGAAKKGNTRDTTEGMYLDPRYDDAFKFGDTETVHVHESDGDINADDENISDPREYETDKPVSEKAAAMGIRAWRQITSPDIPDVHTYLPIWREDAFPEEVRHLIPQLADVTHPELYVDHQHLEYEIAWSVMETDRAPALTGHAGTGKTELWNYLSWRCQMPKVILSIRPDTEVEELVGKFRFTPERGTYFQQGRLSAWVTRPSFVLLDEARTGAEEVWTALRPLFDDRKYLPLDQDEGQLLHKHDFCFIGTADNFSYDPRYVGVKEISEADRDRMEHVLIGLPPEHLERKMLLRRLKTVADWQPSPDVLDKVMAIATQLRQMAEGDDLSITWGIRPQIKVLENMRGFPPEKAYRRAMLNDLEPQTVDQVLSVVRDFF